MVGKLFDSFLSKLFFLNSLLVWSNQFLRLCWALCVRVVVMVVGWNMGGLDFVFATEEELWACIFVSIFLLLRHTAQKSFWVHWHFVHTRLVNIFIHSVWIHCWSGWLVGAWVTIGSWSLGYFQQWRFFFTWTSTHRGDQFWLWFIDGIGIVILSLVQYVSLGPALWEILSFFSFACAALDIT